MKNWFEEILNDLVNPDMKLSDILRKANILASILKNDEFKEWVRYELNGYRQTDKEELPDYRKGPAHIRGDFFGAFGSALKNAEVPLMSLPQPLRDWARETRILDGVSALENLVENDTEGTFKLQWPTDFVVPIRNQIYDGYACMSIWHMLSRPHVAQVLDTIRNRLQNFILELQERHPEIANSVEAAKQIPEREVYQLFMTNIFGNQGSNIAVNRSSVANSSANVTTINNDADLVQAIQALRGLLSEVEQGKQQEVEAAIDVLEGSVVENTVPRGEIAKAVEVVAQVPAMRQQLENLGVGVTGSLAASGLIEAIKFVLGG